MLKVIVLGYGELAQALILGVLASRHRLVAAMRWQKEFIKDIFLPDQMLTTMRANNIKEVKAKKANSKSFVREMRRLRPDVIIVGAWGEIIKKELFGLPKVAFINTHPSLLPKHRGPNPYTSVIREDEIITGVTFHLMGEKIDGGDLLAQEAVEILPDETGGSLRLKCANKARRMVGPLLDGLEQGAIIPMKQNEKEASYYPPLKEEDVIINWNHPAEYINRQVRSLIPGTAMYTRYGNNLFLIRSCEIVEVKRHFAGPGVVLVAEGSNILVTTGDPHRALLLHSVELFGFFSRLWSKKFIEVSVKQGDRLT